MTDGEQDLEQKAFEDLDAIAGVADAALIAREIGDDDAVQTCLEWIKEKAEAWEDPDSPSFENVDSNQ